MITSVKKFEDENDHVIKFVVEFGKDVRPAITETVLYKYPDYKTRTVVCFSVQSGCPIGCTFCGTGNKFVRNLTQLEIVSQVEIALKETGIDPTSIKKFQLMSMSMGEPFLNYKNLLSAFRFFKNSYPNATRLVSTSAPDVPNVYSEFIEEASTESGSDIGLQFSIHESTDVMRNSLIPFQRKLNLDSIADLGEEFFEKTGRKSFINYCVHEKNSSSDDVNRLTSVFDPCKFNCTISVICDKNTGISNTRNRNLAIDFGSKMLERGYDVRVFDSAGQDTIGGGCGQLWHTQAWMKKNKENVNVL